MVRSSPEGEVVRLSISNWLTIATMLGVLCTSLVTGAVKISNSVAELRLEAVLIRGLVSEQRAELTDVKSRVDRVERRLDGRTE